MPNPRFSQNSIKLARRNSWRRLPLLLLAFAVVILPGCLVNRLVEVKRQSCNFEQNFSVNFEGDPEILMLHPVMLEHDIELIFGTTPSHSVLNDDVLTATYVFEQVRSPQDPGTPESGFEFRFEFEFKRVNDVNLLSRVSTSTLPEGIVPQDYNQAEAMSNAAMNMCNKPFSPFSRKRLMELDPNLLQDLPGRQDVLDMMGPPTEFLNGGNALMYAFRLNGSMDEDHLVRTELRFDEDRNQLISMETSFLRYHFRADINSATAVMTLSL
jgi:hypothetical protein